MVRIDEDNDNRPTPEWGRVTPDLAYGHHGGDVLMDPTDSRYVFHVFQHHKGGLVFHNCILKANKSDG